mmetsp:Transcript_49090/g.68221  ORF Transcript_49090/g.68221 Transcript_49090/m.68221 type:complete len:113 (-) Transcript_49090:270-608(-)
MRSSFWSCLEAPVSFRRRGSEGTAGEAWRTGLAALSSGGSGNPKRDGVTLGLDVDTGRGRSRKGEGESKRVLGVCVCCWVCCCVSIGCIGASAMISKGPDFLGDPEMWGHGA